VHQNKHWFTLVEMIMVIAVVAILFLIISNGFQSTTNHQTQAQWCLQHSYAQVQSRLYGALTQKIIPSDPDTVPTSYTIHFDPTEQKISLGYDQTNDYESIALDNAYNIWCHNANYQVQMTGEKVDITMINQTMQSNNFTGIVWFLLCENQECNPLGSIYYDTRTQQFRLYLCPQDVAGFCIDS